ncbi:uncharacterized protein F5891DRAFT_1014258 [Suillus fuscotomentosus]|uniref:Uncharacterized protein n=1 Tax=Suillus fuscotomentosus TaxID=1912939 RepID=A0AAD4HPS6_9AGAM|nr:uncharacterized protein F5891DRAFT_1014258 [Suillus fuscotomentosus]KAG1904347.1 hypothetical protein F5891DRAFT_1014258 [Suillus fuscotomentosus]
MSNNIRKLDRRAVFKSLAKRLSTLENFLYATDEIMGFDHSEDCELQPYGEKIIALTEVARQTLREKMGVSLLMICPEEHVPYKAAYCKLLIWIRHRRSAFPTHIDDRINSLLDNINHNMVVRTRGIDPRAQLGIEELLIVKKPRAACDSTFDTAAVSSTRESCTSCSEMGASFSSKAVCSRILYESPTL